jgi:Legume lectin domain
LIRESLIRGEPTPVPTCPSPVSPSVAVAALTVHTTFGWCLATTFTGGINLHSGDIFQVQMSYRASTLTMTITDLTDPANTFTTSFPINLPATVGGKVAFVGFTGGTGGQTATQEILNWTYSTP